ncbi:Crp/Fnr family transcriptional regulator [Novosphingobium sp. 9]|uniref:Crp/Fnr family transcriptional regulator n=1 Tax=Novosphingobium sp. 9 TaxID=2025349 RepID=UPI0021B576EB|nr:Crp/Fnr family transcriptional regulator [Novosphingobium sp. 9]
MAPGNDLMAVLLDADRHQLETRLEEVHFHQGHVIYESGDNVDYCYFPCGDALSSYFVLLDSGIAVETIMVGREGALGGIVSQGALPSYARANVLHGGRYLRLPVRELDAIKQENAAVRHLFARYADCVMAQVFQSIACNAVHTIEQRAAKWLTAAVERIGRNEVTMTQEQLASMMGIGRSYASRVLQRFKAEGLLRTRRGGIEVLKPIELAERACNCNTHVRRHFETVLGGVYPKN